MVALEEQAKKRVNPTYPTQIHSIRQNPLEAVANSKGAGNIEGVIATKIQTVSDPRQRDYIWQQFCVVTFPL